MSKIVINTDGLIKNAQNLSKRLDELQQLNKQMESTLNTIESSWHGHAGEAYVQMMRKYLKQGKQMEQVLQEFKKYAEATTAEFTAADKNSACRINSSF